MNRLFALLLVVMASPTAPDAQDLPGPEGRTETLGAITALPHRQALEATLRYEYYRDAAKTAAWWAGFSGDPTLRPLLRQIAETYAADQATVSAAALGALAMLGEPPAYFVGFIRTRYSTDTFAPTHAVYALFASADPSAADALRSLTSLVARSGQTESLAGWGDALDREHAAVAAARSAEPVGSPIRNEIDILVARFLPVGYGGRLDFYEADSLRPGIATNYHAAVDPDTYFGLGRLQQLSAAYPDSVRMYLPAALAATAERIAEDRLSVEGVQIWAMKAALPHEPFPAPPANPSADVAPILECVASSETGLTAYFGYDNRTGAPVSVPYGTANRLVVGSAPPLTRQPSAFSVPRSVEGQPGRSPLWPGYAVSVTFAPGETATWTLPGGSATASNASARCDGSAPPPAVPLCAGRAATVYVAPDGRVAGGPLDGTPFAGRLLGTPGPDVIVGTTAEDALDGGAGDDTLCALDGDDALYGGDGTDSADGGTGIDRCAAETTTACERPFTPAAVPTCAGQTATVYVRDGRVVGGTLAGQAYAGRLAGGNGADVLVGTDAADVLDGGNGPDTLCGGAGADTLAGGNGPDTLVGGPGADAADGGAGPDACAAEAEQACESNPAAPDRE